MIAGGRLTVAYSLAGLHVVSVRADWRRGRTMRSNCGRSADGLAVSVERAGRRAQSAAADRGRRCRGNDVSRVLSWRRRASRTGAPTDIPSEGRPTSDPIRHPDLAPAQSRGGSHGSEGGARQRPEAVISSFREIRQQAIEDDPDLSIKKDLLRAISFIRFPC